MPLLEYSSCAVCLDCEMALSDCPHFPLLHCCAALFCVLPPLSYPALPDLLSERKQTNKELLGYKGSQA